MRVFGARRSRRHSNGWYFFLAGAQEPDQGAPMIVAVKQKLRSLCGQHSAKIGGVDEASKITSRRADRRVMDQHHAEAAAGLLEGFGETSELPLAKPSRRQERSARDGGRKRNQGHVAPAADKRESLKPVVASHIIAPKFSGQLLSTANVNVVVTRNDE